MHVSLIFTCTFNQLGELLVREILPLHPFDGNLAIETEVGTLSSQVKTLIRLDSRNDAACTALAAACRKFLIGNAIQYEEVSMRTPKRVPTTTVPLPT